MTSLLCVLTVTLAASEPDWQTDYPKAVAAARESKKMLFITFGANLTWPVKLALNQTVRDECLFLRLPRDAQIDIEGKPLKLLEHAAFAAMQSRAGLAILDFKNPGPNFGCVVSVLPLEHASTAARVLALFTLPGGSLTQRTLVWALRVDAEAPKSTNGEPNADLMGHAHRHSWEQARLNWQHHNLPRIASSEIVAESWPWNKCIVAAALDIVHSWRQSPGHWRAASQPHRYYGYDMQTVGLKWFATGVFID